jgi:hypothetical protein
MCRHYRCWPIVSAAAVAFLMPSVAGCNGVESLPREAVSGSVSIDGKPVKIGVITFLPDSPAVPTQGGGTITEGKYAIPQAEGLVPGKYRIVITSPEDKPEVFPDKDFNNNAPGMKPVRRKQIVPSQYNSKSVLTAEVRAGSPNAFEFNLTGTPIGK